MSRPGTARIVGRPRQSLQVGHARVTSTRDARVRLPASTSNRREPGMAVDVTRRRFTQGSIAVGGGLALAGPISALTARAAEGRSRQSPGYGPIQPTPEEDSGVAYIALPPGFRYRIISRQNEPMD